MRRQLGTDVLCVTTRLRELPPESRGTCGSLEIRKTLPPCRASPAGRRELPPPRHTPIRCSSSIVTFHAPAPSARRRSRGRRLRSGGVGPYAVLRARPTTAHAEHSNPDTQPTTLLRARSFLSIPVPLVCHESLVRNCPTLMPGTRPGCGKRTELARLCDLPNRKPLGVARGRRRDGCGRVKDPFPARGDGTGNPPDGAQPQGKRTHARVVDLDPPASASPCATLPRRATPT